MEMRECGAHRGTDLVCSLRYDHDGLHHDRFRDVSWSRLRPSIPPGKHDA